jgi:hypothetical protein
MSASINLATLEPGTRLTLMDGRIIEIVDNPKDGSWLVCCTEANRDDEFLLGAQDIAGFA